jgi:hypothetical protein
MRRGRRSMRSGARCICEPSELAGPRMKNKPELKIVVSNTPAEAPAAEAAPEQVEMPFAVVNGEPVTQLPRDLYIPPQALEVFL